jgi:hypothetical protein
MDVRSRTGSTEVDVSVGKTLKREVRVAISRRAQPVWFRVLKWVILVGVSVLLWRGSYFWLWMVAALVVGLTVHSIWRWKTKGWTRPWGGWDDLEAAGKD